LENSPVDLRRLESANLILRGWMRIWIWVIKNILKSNLAQYNMHAIFTLCTKKCSLLDISPPYSRFAIYSSKI